MKEFIKKLFLTIEGRILFFGIFLIVLTFFILSILYFINIQTANSISAMIATNLFVGRVPSLSLGYASELSHGLVIGTNVLTEMILVLILYPLFVLSFNNIFHVKFLEKFFEDVKKFRIKHKILFEKYGVFGLFIFVFFPFWMTGPIVGSIIGFMIGLRHMVVIPVVFIATVIAISLWGVFLKEIVTLINSISSDAVYIILAVFIGVFILYKVFKRGSKK